MLNIQSQEVKGAVSEGMTLDQVRKTMIDLMMEENVNHHRMGQLYNYVVKNRLAQNAGYKDARDYFRKTLADLAQSSLSMYGAVAASFSEAVTRRYGVTCLYLLLAYETATGQKFNHAELGGVRIEVPGENGEVRARLFDECTSEDLRNAVRHKRKPASSQPVPAQYVALAEQYQVAVKNRFPAGTVITVVARNQKGDSVIDIKGIPAAQMDLLLEALMDELPAVPELLPPMPQVPRVVTATVS